MRPYYLWLLSASIEEPSLNQTTLNNDIHIYLYAKCKKQFYFFGKSLLFIYFGKTDTNRIVVEFKWIRSKAGEKM